MFNPGSKQPSSKASDSPTFTSSSDLIIGIDFGTTFTGVAYAHTTGGPSDTISMSDIRKAAKKIAVIKSWPHQTNQYVEKTPSVLSYNSNPPRWGGTVKKKDQPQIAHFKLGLQESIGNHYLQENILDLFGKQILDERTRMTSPVLGGYLTDHNWRHPELPEKTAVDYTADYLTGICQYVTNTILPSRFGANFLKNQQISYVITVPAIWSDKAKNLTRQAAISAGISPTKLMLITEPEAAALYCATLCEEVDLQTGDRFLICDAGGGTVVFLHFRVPLSSGSHRL